MDHLLCFQKLCQLDTRRLLFVMGLAFALALVLQSSTLPHGNILASLFSSAKIPLLRSSSSSSRDVGKQHEHTSYIRSEYQNITGSPPIKSSFGNSFHGEDPVREDVRSPDSGHTIEKASAPRPSLYMEHVQQSNGYYSVDYVQADDTILEVETVGSPITSVSTSPALPPVFSSYNFTFHNNSDADSSVPNISVTPNISSVGKESTETHLSDGVSSGSGYNSITRERLEPHTPVFKLNNLLLQSRESVHSMRPLWSSNCDHELLSAKSEIGKAPIIQIDPELHPSVFRNFSAFKRSYELMEQLLKVYIYAEGEKPIFHEPTDPILKGIYASEGWFMRHMENNKQFVVKDPLKAHLFYLPFSSRMLQLQLYVRNSHSRKNLADYVKNYVHMIATKYPFWNRTGGADHFVVACHDWAPFETRGHMDNCIKVLCNANIARDFQIGKDVALPTTQVRKIGDPLRGVGGNPPSERSTLAFFAGGMHGSLRPLLLQYWGKDPDMKIFGQMPQGTTVKYAEHMKSSKFCICPKGFDVNSPRVVEAIFYECIPVIISDNYVPPFFEVLDWEAFAVFVPEKDVLNLKDILLSISEEKYLEMHLRVKGVQKHFLWHMEPVKYDLFHMILHSVWFNRLNMM